MVWISGASSGIGAALARSVPDEDARIIGISRRAPDGRAPDGIEHLPADLSDPASWREVGDSFERELANFDGDRAVFVHSAGTIEPLGFAGEVDTDGYATNVVLNSAAPQVLGHLFLAAARHLEVECHLVMITSGAARSVYQGWSSYGAGKAAIDQWVRNVGAEQDRRGGVHVLSIAPGTVDTAMQGVLRTVDEDDFPQRQKFLELHRERQLSDVDDIAVRIWSLLEAGLDNGSVVDLRQFDG